MPMADGSKVRNGNAFYRGSIRITFVDEIVEFIGEYSFSHKLERGFGYGMNKAQGPKKKTRGKYVPGGVKLKGFMGGIQKMREKVAAMSESGTCYGEPSFAIMIQGIERNESPVDRTFESCGWDEESSQVGDDGNPINDELQFHFMETDVNGLTLNDTSEEV